MKRRQTTALLLGMALTVISLSGCAREKSTEKTEKTELTETASMAIFVNIISLGKEIRFFVGDMRRNRYICGLLLHLKYIGYG